MSLSFSEIVELTKLELSKTYQPLIFEINSNGQVLSGQVVLRKQKELLFENLQKNSFSFEDKIIILSDWKNEPPFGYGQASWPVVNVYRKPILNPEKLSPRGFSLLRSTQVTPTDFSFRLLYKKDGWFLVHLLDRTLGWIHENEIILKGKTELGETKPYNQTTFRDKIFSYLNTRYLIGGTTKSGIDCSGFVQRVFLESMNLLLPKFSKAQKKKGISIRREDLRNADLIFGVSKARETSHVGIFFEKEIFHSCLRKKQVAEESIEDFEKYYYITDYRRII